MTEWIFRSGAPADSIAQLFAAQVFLQKLLKTNLFVKSHYLYGGALPIHHFQFFTMYSGIVKFFNESKGFGFIVDNSSKEEIFVHVTGLVDNIREGDSVTFDTERGKKGMNAVNVKIA